MSFLHSCLNRIRRRTVVVIRRDSDPAPELLFGEARPAEHGSERFVVAGRQLPYRLTRREKFVVPFGEAAALTITSVPYNSVAVFGKSRREWSISCSAQDEGESEREAQERLQQLTLRATGARLALIAPGLYEGSHRRGDLVVEGPTDAGVVIHCT